MKNRLSTSLIFSIGFIISIALFIFVNAIKVEGNDIILDIDLSTLTSISFILLTASTSFLISYSFIASYFLKRDKLHDTEDFRELKKNYKNKLKFTKNKELFMDYVDFNNINEKKKKFKEKILDKIEKLNSKLSKYSIDEHNTDKYKRLKNKLEYYKTQLDQTYIDEHILELEVKYKKIYAKNFRNNDYLFDVDDRKLTSNENRILTAKVAKKVISSVIFSVVLTTFITTIVIQFKFSENIVILVLSTSISCFTQAILGAYTSNKIFIQEQVVPIENKINIIEDFIVYCKKNNLENESGFEDVLNDLLIRKQNENQTKE